MAAPGSWAQIEKATLTYLKKPSTQSSEGLDRVLTRATDFAEKIARFFVRNHNGLEEARVCFRPSADAEYPEKACQYEEETHTFWLSTPAILLFKRDCENVREIMQTSRGRENFSIYRLNAYMSELNKLSSQLLMFLLLFQEMGRVLQVTTVEGRRNTKHEVNPADLDYLNFLWAFRELENLYWKLKGTVLRTEFSFIWFEADWINEKR